MNYESIVLCFLIVGFLGMVEILFLKIPVLVSLPEITKEAKLPLFSKIKRGLSIVFQPKFILWLPLQKTLLRFKTLTSATEDKTNALLKKLERKSNSQAPESADHSEKDNYWDEIRKAKDQ